MTLGFDGSIVAALGEKSNENACVDKTDPVIGTYVRIHTHSLKYTSIEQIEILVGKGFGKYQATLHLVLHYSW